VSVVDADSVKSTEGLLSIDKGVARRSSSCAGVKAPTKPAADSDALRRVRGILLRSKTEGRTTEKTRENPQSDKSSERIASCTTSRT
jgi:hypothetical protein